MLHLKNLSEEETLKIEVIITLFGSLRGLYFFHILKLKSGGYFIAVKLKCLRLPLTPRALLGIKFFIFHHFEEKGKV